MGKMVGARAGADIVDKLEPEQQKNGQAPQHRINSFSIRNISRSQRR
jgi:hypothetical protein